jgi:hypothetical protein
MGLEDNGDRDRKTRPYPLTNPQKVQETRLGKSGAIIGPQKVLTISTTPWYKQNPSATWKGGEKFRGKPGSLVTYLTIDRIHLGG